MLVIKISFQRWPAVAYNELWAERIKDALIHVLRLAGLIDAEITIEVQG